MAGGREIGSGRRAAALAMVVLVLVAAGCGGDARSLGTVLVDPAAGFQTLPPGAELPGDAECASRVRPMPVEVRDANLEYNQTRGPTTPADADPNYPRYGRVTGDFVGSTDEIIQWVACKWGIDEDVVRAQAAKETYWFQENVGDFTTDPERCVPGHPLDADGRPGECPESIGIMQVRYPYFRTTIEGAVASTAYNLDLAYAVWRTCFEGEETWLGDVDPGRPYEAGDLWGASGAGSRDAGTARRRSSTCATCRRISTIACGRRKGSSTSNPECSRPPNRGARATMLRPGARPGEQGRCRRSPARRVTAPTRCVDVAEPDGPLSRLGGHR